MELSAELGYTTDGRRQQEDGSKEQRPPSRVAVFTIDYKTVYRACRVTEVGAIGQRFQPKEHLVLTLG